MKIVYSILGSMVLLAQIRLGAVEPRPPLELRLNPDIIQSLGLHQQIDLTLVFPGEVTMITGQGLTSGEVPGKVQFQQGTENPEILTLRLLDSKASVVMHVIVEKQVFVFRLSASERPATVIRYSWDEGANPAVMKGQQISEEEANKQKAPISIKRLKQMADLVGAEPSLRGKLPEAYGGYEAINTDFSSEKIKGLTLNIHRIARFTEEDTLVFFGSLENGGKSSYRHSPQLATLMVGGLAFSGTTFLQARESTPAGESTYVWFTLTGDGAGEPLHLSLKNKFSFQLKP